AGLRRLGLPEAIGFSSVSVTPDKELKNINLHIKVTPPFTDSPSTLILPLMSNGKFNVDASVIEAFVRTTITKVYQPAINTWMQRFSGSIVLPGTPFEFSADNTNVEYLFDQRYLRVTTTFTLLDTRDGTRTSWDVDTTVNGHGVSPPVFNLPDAAEKKLIAYLEGEIRDALPDDVDRFLSHVNFSVDNGKPAATVYWDLRFAGCEINNS